jgi:hypothetical protein
VRAWNALVRLLPAGTDTVWFRSELDRIAVNYTELKQQRKRFLNQVRILDEVLADVRLDQGEVIALRAEYLAQVYFITRRMRKWKARCYIELLILGARAGVEVLNYTSTPAPHGPGIEYLQAAAAAIGVRSLKAYQARHWIMVYGSAQPGGAQPADTAMSGAGALRADTIHNKADPSK